MADIVSSIFGISPDQIRLQQQQQDRQFAQELAATQATPYAREQSLLGATVGSGLVRGVAGLLGIQDPQLKRASELESILAATQQELGADAGNPEIVYPALAKKLGEAGYSREALQAIELGRSSQIAATKSYADLLKARKEGDTRSEYQKTLDDLAKATADGDTNRANFLKQRLNVLGTEGTAAPSTDKLAAEQFAIINNPNSTPAQIASAQRLINDIYQFKNVPPGFERDAASGQVRAIPQGPADIKQQEANRKLVGSLKSKLESISSVEKAFETASKLIDQKTTGLVGSVLKNVPGEPAYDLQAALETIAARLSFDTLQDMRNNSPTGGALGNVSNLELESLKAAIANLKQSQSESQLRSNLDNVMALYNRIKSAAQQDLESYQATTPATKTSPKGSFTPGRTYTDKDGNKAVYQQDGTWREVK